MVAGQKNDVLADAGAFVALLHNEVRILRCRQRRQHKGEGKGQQRQQTSRSWHQAASRGGNGKFVAQGQQEGKEFRRILRYLLISLPSCKKLTGRRNTSTAGD